MIEEEIIEEYGGENWEAMQTSKYLQDITLSVDKKGNVDIPRSDVKKAYRDQVLDENVSPLEWD